MNICIKWFLVVWFNTILGFLFGYNNQGDLYLMGMIMGVMTWYLLYLCMDYFLKKSGREKESRRMLISALIRIPLQLTLVPDIYAGFAAAFTLEFLGVNSHGKFIDAYFMTVFTGFYLSLVCGVIYLLIMAIGKFIESRKNLQRI
jgi:hypothetical protein